MPIEGFKSLTMSETVYNKLAILAKEDKRSLQQELDYLLDVELQNRKTATEA